MTPPDKIFESDELESLAAEARLLNDGETLRRIACQPSCSSDLLRRLAGIGKAGLTVAVLRHPACPLEVIADACRGGSSQERILAALNPNATPDILDRLVRLGQVRVSTAVLLNPAVLPSTVADIGKAPRLKRLAKTMLQINDDTSWQELDRLLPADVARNGQQLYAGWMLATDPDVPIEIIATMIRAGIGGARMLRHPTARARIVDLLPALDHQGCSYSDLAEVLAIPLLPLRAASWLLERLLDGWRASRKNKAPSTGHRHEYQARPGEWLLLIDEAARRSTWAQAAVNDLVALSAKHPRVYVGFLDNDSIVQETRDTLRSKVDEIGSAFIESWPVARLLAPAEVKAKPRSSRTQRGPSLDRLPIPLAAGVAARADVRPDEVRALYVRRSKAIDAALIAAGRLTPEQIGSRADVTSPTLREALARSELTPPNVLEDLVTYVVAAELDDEFALTLLGHPGLSVAQQRRVLDARSSYRYARYRDFDRELILRDEERAGARVQPTPEHLRKRIPRLRSLEPYLLRRTDIPLAAREALVAASHNHWLRLLMPETRLEGLEDLFDACDAASLSTHSLQSPAHEMLDDGWLFLCSDLPAAALNRAAELLRGDRWSSMGLRRLCRHPAADESLLERLVHQFDFSPDGVAECVAWAPRASSRLLELILSRAESPAVRRAVAAHPNAPLAFLLTSLRSRDDLLRQRAAAHAKVPREAIFDALVERKGQEQEVARVLAWLELGPGRSEVLSIVQRAGGQPDPVSEAETAWLLLDPARLHEGIQPHTFDLLLQPDISTHVYGELVRRVAAGGNMPASLIRIVARTCRDPDLLAELGERVSCAHAPALLANPALRLDDARAIANRCEPRRWNGLEHVLTSQEIQRIDDTLARAECSRFDPRVEASPSGPQYDVDWLLRYVSVTSTRFADTAVTGAHAELLAADPAILRQAAAAGCLREISTPGRFGRTPGDWKLLAKVFGNRVIAWALSDERLVSDRWLVLTAASAAEKARKERE